MDRTEQLRRYWDRMSGSYDPQMRFFDRVLFLDSRAWVCGQATGDVLEVAIGTGLNLPHYPPGTRLTGLDFSPGMLDLTRRRAAELGLDVDLRLGDAQALPFDDASFDTAVCTFSLCAVRDDTRAVHEMIRVLRPGGLLLLADHVVATAWPARAVQRLLDRFTIPAAEEHWRRRPYLAVRASDLTIERHERFRLGMVERLAARRPR